MPALASLIPELEDVLSRGTAAKRAETLRRITDLFIDGAGRYDESHVGLFDDVLSSLIVEIETKTLAEIARRLGPVSNAPVKVIRRLASRAGSMKPTWSTSPRPRARPTCSPFRAGPRSASR
jgi:uncharacterized protein (DUF2336 family)